TVAGHDCALHGFLEPELEVDVEIAQAHAGPTKLLLDHRANAGAGLHHDQRLIAELVQRQRLPGEAMFRRTDEHDLVPEERLEGDRPLSPRCADDAELELTGRD